jgi:hypothetical protein
VLLAVLLPYYTLYSPAPAALIPTFVYLKAGMHNNPGICSSGQHALLSDGTV